MRSIFVGIIVLSASMTALVTAQAQTLQRPSNYGYGQTSAHRQQPANDEVKSIEKDNQDLELPASQDDIVGADQVHSEEEAQTKRVDQDGARIDREIRNICPSC